MNTSGIKNKDRVIGELALFIRKVLSEPEICGQCKEIARKHLREPNANQVIAEEISGSTNVRIPLEHSEADELFLEILKEVVKDEEALY